MQIGTTTFDRYSSRGWTGFVQDGYAAMFGMDLDAWLAGESAMVLDAACRQVRRHQTPRGVVYSKLMWAQNDQAYREKLFHKWIKWALGPSRAVRILKVSSEMIARGHWCAEPLLAVRRRVWSGWHLNLLVTAEVKAPTVQELILHGDAVGAVRRAGAELAKLHGDEFVHGDFLPRNCCLSDEKFYFLDNDKSRRWCKAPFGLQRRNLDQFTYNLMLLKGVQECNRELPMAFLESYAETSGWSHQRRDSEIDRVMQKAVRRWEEDAAEESGIADKKLSGRQ